MGPIAIFRRTGVLLLAIQLVLVPLSGRDRGAAREAYQKARGYHDRLLAKPQAARSRKDYNQVIFLYRRVIDHDPTYGAADDALYAVATLYHEMAQRFERKTDWRRAIYYYEFVAREYPRTKHREAALERARLLQHPAPHPAGPTPPDGSTVSEIRYWSNEDYTRVVIQLDREVTFEKHILSDPDRIYFDLQNATLKSGLERQAYDVNGLFITGIRVAQNRPGVVRVVLDYEEIKKHTVFALYEPFRIVIDTHGDSTGSQVSRQDEEGDRAAEVAIPLDEPLPTESLASVPPVVPAPNRDGQRSLTRVLGLKVGRVVIDPGHGGADTGTIGPNGLQEKDLVLAVSRRLKTLLQERLGTEVVLTREADQFVPLEERTAIANHLGADLFVSIHANSSRSRRVSGAETFFQGLTTNPDEREVASRENASSQRNIRELEDLLKRIALGDYNEESQDLAHVVQHTFHAQLKEHLPRFRNRGVKKAPFIVLINLNMPGILLEIGFISNPVEERYLKREEAQRQVAEAIYKGIETYFQSLGAVPRQARTAAGD